MVTREHIIFLVLGWMLIMTLPIVLYEKWFLKKKIETFSIVACGIMSVIGLVIVSVTSWSLLAASP